MRIHLRPNRPGQPRGGVTPLAVLSLGLLLGVVALAVDGGTLLEARRHAQAAADAAALAAASDLLSNYAANGGADPRGTASASAVATAAANGFANDGVTSVVTVTLSGGAYQSGPNAGKPVPAGYAEVIVQYNVGRLFSGVFGAGTTAVRTRAVARGQWLPVASQVVALNPTASASVSVTGSAAVNISGGLLVNSSSSSAVTVSPGASLSATSVTLNSSGGGIVGSLLNLVGGLLGGLLGGGGGGGGSAPPTNYGPPVPDPLRQLPDPNPVTLGLALQGTNLNIRGGTASLQPGVYQGGIRISQGASVTLQPNADGSPGIYYLQGGGLTVSGPSSLTVVSGNTAGVMIYNDWNTRADAINLSGTGSTVLAPPTSGAYEGMTIFQKRGTAASPAPALTMVGVGNTNVTGTIYVAYGDVTLTGTAGTNVMGGQIIADQVSGGGNGTINVNPGGNPVAHNRLFGLVE